MEAVLSINTCTTQLDNWGRKTLQARQMALSVSRYTADSGVMVSKGAHITDNPWVCSVLRYSPQTRLDTSEMEWTWARPQRTFSHYWTSVNLYWQLRTQFCHVLSTFWEVPTSIRAHWLQIEGSQYFSGLSSWWKYLQFVSNLSVPFVPWNFFILIFISPFTSWGRSRNTKRKPVPARFLAWFFFNQRWGLEKNLNLWKLIWTSEPFRFAHQIVRE